MDQNSYSKLKRRLTGSAMSILCAWSAYGQEVNLSNLSAFKTPSPNWQITSSVHGDPTVKYSLDKSSEGTGILVNLPADSKQAKDIYTVAEHGDADIELEFMIAKESNSGIYLQGRYEIQLLDSWGKKYAAAGDCGGIYERWDESRPEGQKGYQGYAPRQNASRVPGVWQKMRISFQAPKFDKNGKKTENARILSLYLNDLLIHENVELTGPTRGGMNNNEVARGPLRFQGDHGPVAFRNIVIKSFDTPKPALKDLSYLVHDGRVLKQEELAGLKGVKEGKGQLIDYTVSDLTNNYVIRYKGKITIPVKGNYRFAGAFWGGYGNLIIGGKEVLPFSSWHQNSAEVELPAGDLPFEYTYSKVNEGDRPGFGLAVWGPGIRQTVLHEVGSVNTSRVSNPILLEPARETAVHRSFIDFNGSRLPYGVSVGTIGGVNYSLNLANGSLFRVWRGDFLNVTPMWLDRGNGTSMPLGSVLNLNDVSQFTAVDGKQNPQYLLKGYKVDEQNNPTFLYSIDGKGVQDRISADATGKYLERVVTTDDEKGILNFAIARGKEMVVQAGGLIQVDGAYFIKMAEGNEAIIKSQDGVKTLTVTSAGKIAYSIIW